MSDSVMTYKKRREIQTPGIKVYMELNTIPLDSINVKSSQLTQYLFGNYAWIRPYWHYTIHNNIWHCKRHRAKEQNLHFLTVHSNQYWNLQICTMPHFRNAEPSNKLLFDDIFTVLKLVISVAENCSVGRHTSSK